MNTYNDIAPGILNDTHENKPHTLLEEKLIDCVSAAIFNFNPDKHGAITKMIVEGILARLTIFTQCPGNDATKAFQNWRNFVTEITRNITENKDISQIIIRHNPTNTFTNTLVNLWTSVNKILTDITEGEKLKRESVAKATAKPGRGVVIGSFDELRKLSAVGGLEAIQKAKEQALQALLAQVREKLAPGMAQVNLREEIEVLKTATQVEGTIFPPGEAPNRDGSLVSPPSVITDTRGTGGERVEAWERLAYMGGFKPDAVFKADFDGRDPYYVFFFQPKTAGNNSTYIAIAECPYGDNRTYIFPSKKQDEWIDVFIETTKEDAHILGSLRLNHTDTYKERLEKILGEYGIHQQTVAR